MSHLKSLTAVLACLALVGGGLLGQGPKSKEKEKDEAPKLAAANTTPEVGEITLDYTFKNLVNGDGRGSMKELRGNVILIDWWGYH